MRDIHLRSGKWRCIDDPASAGAGGLELVDPAAPENKLLIRPPDPGAGEPRPASLEPDSVAQAASQPDVRLWTDEFGIPWRITRVGPKTRYPYPFETPLLVFDSERAFAGIVAVGPGTRLGELRNDELRRYRDRMTDFGGRRRAFRPPSPPR